MQKEQLSNYAPSQVYFIECRKVHLLRRQEIKGLNSSYNAMNNFVHDVFRTILLKSAMMRISPRITLLAMSLYSDLISDSKNYENY